MALSLSHFHPPPGAFYGWLARHDPGLIRAVGAVKMALAIALALIAAEAARALSGGLFGHSSITYAVLGSGVVMMAVKGADRRARQLAMVGSAVAGSAAIVAVAAMSPVPHLADALVPVVIFVAYYCRRFGPHFVTIGLLGVIPYLVGTVFRSTLADTPPEVAAFVAGIGFAFVVRFYVLGRWYRRAYIDTARAALDSAAAIFDSLAKDLQTGTCDRPKIRALADDFLARTAAMRDAMDAFLAQGEQNPDAIDLEKTISAIELSVGVATESAIALTRPGTCASPPVAAACAEICSAMANRLHCLCRGQAAPPSSDAPLDAARDALLAETSDEHPFTAFRCLFALRRVNALIFEAERALGRLEEAG